MNASPEDEKGAQVIDFVEAKLKEEMKKGGVKKAAEVAAPYIMKAREVGMIKARHDELMAMTPELQDEFINAVASNTVDQAWYKGFTDKLRYLMPAGFLIVQYESIKDGSWAIMLLTGMVGDARLQNEFARRANPGMIESLLGKILPVIAKFDLEPDTRVVLEFVIKAMQAKGFTLEALGQLRTAVQAHEVKLAAEAKVAATREKTEDGANYAARMPAGDHKEPGQINLDNAMGPEAPKRKAA